MLEVVAGVFKHNNKILIAQRPKEKHMGDKWEFPGGKVEQGETDQHALIRELQEEFETIVKVQDHICAVQYDYANLSVNINVYYVEAAPDTIKMIEHQDIKWIDKKELLQYDLAPADILIAQNILSAE